MGYIGNDSVTQNFTPAVDYFNGNGSTTSFTLSRTVGSAFDVQAFIENVPQNPSSAFTVAGNVITFTSAPPSGTNNIYVRYTSPVTQQVKPAPGTVSPTEINSAYSLWNLSGSDINYTAGNVGIGTSSPTDNFYISRSTNAAGGISVVNTNNAQASQIAQLYLQGGDNAYAQVKLQANSLSSSIRGNGDGSLAFLGGTTERMRITSDGKLGIGTSSPDPALEIRSVSRTSDSTRYNITAIDSSSYAQGNGGGINFGFIWNSNGDPMGRAANIKGIKENSNNNDYASALVFSTTQHSASTTERMRISSSGQLLVGKSSASFSTVGFQCDNDGSLFITKTHGDSGGAQLYLNRLNVNGPAVYFYKDTNNVGNISVTGSATSYNSGSDYRLKNNIEPLTNALQKVALLKPSKWIWKADNTYGDGFVAHELAEVCPNAVTGEKDAVNEDGSIKAQGVDTSFLVATLTAAIQEQQAIIEDLKARIEVLEAK